MTPTVEKIRIDQINIGKRQRKDMGDLRALAESMKDVHIQPIELVRTGKGHYVLKAGERRLRAARDILHWTKIRAEVWEGPEAESDWFHCKLEHDENVHRKDFTNAEKLETYQKLVEAIGSRQGQRKPNDNQAKTQLPGICPEVGQETRDAAAKAAGFANDREARRVETVYEHGTLDLQQAMEEEVISKSDAAAIADQPSEVQKAAVQAVKEGRFSTAGEAVEKRNPPIHDELDEEVPESLRPVFERAVEFHKVVNQLNAINRKLKELKETPAGACMRLQQAQVDLRNLKETVRFDAPYAVCPACKGDGKKRKANCPCKGRGWLVETAYKNLPQEYRQ